ncbi:MAG: hypothetical protein R2873_21275 [Caldilineaceae bacterium]
MRMRYSRWDGANLSAPIKIAPGVAENGHASPAVAISESIWVDPTQLHLFWSGGDEQAIAQIYTMQWTANQLSLVSLDGGSSLADSVQMVGGAEDQIHAVWAQGEAPSRIYHSQLDGNRWRNPDPVSPPDWVAAFPSIAIAPDGAPHVVWYGNEPESTSRIYHTRWTPAGWTTPTLLSTEDDPAATPDIAVDVNGDIHVVWEMSIPSDYPKMAIYYRRTTGGGAIWTDTVRLSPVGVHANRPELDLDSGGHPHVVWYNLDDEEIYHVQATDDGWSLPENVSNTPETPTTNAFSSQGPVIWVDDADQVHVAWMDSVGQTLLDSVYYARKDGDSWARTQIMSRPEAVRDMDRGAGLNVQIIGHGSNIHLIWHDAAQDGGDFHIYESNNRTGIWSSPTILSQGFGSAIRPAGALDAGGRLHFVWSDLQQARQIFYTRVDRFDWIKVVNEGGLAMSAAQIYRNGHLLGETDERGLFFADALAVDDELVTLAPVDEYAGVRARATTSPDSPTRDWAYRTYLTNWRYAAGGERAGATVANLEGEQLLQVRSDSPLALLNLVVSMEWGASMTETQRFSNALHSASDYLFDATNGQIAIGHAAIYTRGDWWADADIQVLATNYNRPHAQVGGLREPLSAPIRGAAVVGDAECDQRRSHVGQTSRLPHAGPRVGASRPRPGRFVPWPAIQHHRDGHRLDQRQLHGARYPHQ